MRTSRLEIIQICWHHSFYRKRPRLNPVHIQTSKLDLDTRGPSEILYHFLSILEQATYQRASELQLPDCTAYFMKDLQRLAAPGYIPTQVKHTSSQMAFDFRSDHAK